MNSVPSEPKPSDDGPAPDKFSKLFPKIDTWDKAKSKEVFCAATGTWVVKYALWCSFLGDPRLWGVILTILGIYGLIISDLSLAVVFGTGFVQSFLIYYVLKRYFKRKRPFIQLECDGIFRRDKTGHGYSFPSGHCNHSVILVGLLWLQFAPYWWLVPLVLLYNFAVGHSRIISGVHYPTDTIVGTLEAYVFLFFHWFITKDLYLQLYDYLIAFIW
jgi:undecaprenyl-diphosphatase